MRTLKENRKDIRDRLSKVNLRKSTRNVTKLH